MSFSRVLAGAAFGMGIALCAHAAGTSVFSVARQNDRGQPLVFQSIYALKKGDVLKVNTLNAQAVMVLQVAVCDEGCEHPQLVKTLPLAPDYGGQAATSRQYVMQEDGRITFWVQQAGLPGASTPVNTGNGPWSVTYVDPFQRFASKTPYAVGWPMPASALSLADGTLRARFLHRTFVTVSLAYASQ